MAGGTKTPAFLAGKFMISINGYFNRTVTFDAYVGTMSSNLCFETPLVAGDTGPRLLFNVKDAAGAPITVSGMAVNLYMRRYGNSTHSNTGHEGCSGLDPSNGIWIYSLQNGDVSAAGTYFADLEIVYDNGVVETAYEAVRMLVRDNNKG